MNAIMKFLPAWLTKLLNKNVNKYTVKHGGLFDMMFNVRMAEAVANAGKIKCVWIGDSRFAEFESLINAIPGFLCLAISGSKIEDWIARGLPILRSLGAPYVIDDIAGNDFLGGMDVGSVEALKSKWMGMLSTLGSKIKILELCPLTASANATPKFLGVNSKIALYDAWVNTQPWSQIRVNDVFTAGGNMLPQYAVPDGVHWSPAAWSIILNRVQGAIT